MAKHGSLSGARAISVAFMQVGQNSHLLIDTAFSVYLGFCHCSSNCCVTSSVGSGFWPLAVAYHERARQGGHATEALEEVHGRALGAEHEISIPLEVETDLARNDPLPVVGECCSVQGLGTVRMPGEALEDREKEVDSRYTSRRLDENPGGNPATRGEGIRADLIIANDSDLSALRRKVEEAWAQIR